MKKALLLFVAVLFIGACSYPEDSVHVSDVSKTEDYTEVANQKQSDQDISQPLTENELKEIIKYSGMGEGDELGNARLEDKEIKVVINLYPSDLFSNEDLAVTRYSQVSDELLNYEGWKVLTIEYSNIGMISMNRKESETNEYNMKYFPVEEVKERLKYNDR